MKTNNQQPTDCELILENKSHFEHSTNERIFNVSCRFVDRREESVIHAIQLSSSGSSGPAPTIYGLYMGISDKKTADYIKSISSNVALAKKNKGSFLCPDYTYQLHISEFNTTAISTVLNTLGDRFGAIKASISGMLDNLKSPQLNIVHLKGTIEDVSAQADRIFSGERAKSVREDLGDISENNLKI